MPTETEEGVLVTPSEAVFLANVRKNLSEMIQEKIKAFVAGDCWGLTFTDLDTNLPQTLVLLRTESCCECATEDALSFARRVQEHVALSRRMGSQHQQNGG